MTSHQLIIRPPSGNRKQRLLSTSSVSSSSSSISRTCSSGIITRRNNSSSSSVGGGARCAEVCGGTTAECAAVCCCCPCGLVNLLVLAIYKLPAGLCRRAIRQKRRQRLLKKGLLQPRRRQCQCGFDDSEIHPVVCFQDFSDVQSSEETEKAVMELEKEMWDRFYGTGFWRSPSQKESPSGKQP